MFRAVAGATLLIVASSFMSGCQEPSDPDETPDFIEIDFPEVVNAGPSDGRTYVIPHEDVPDEVVPYSQFVRFEFTVRLTQAAHDEGVDIEFPVQITQVPSDVQMASGGIVIAPPPGQQVYKEGEPALVEGGRTFGDVGQKRVTYDVWYDLPNDRREALIRITVNFVDDDGVTFSESFDVRVAP